MHCVADCIIRCVIPEPPEWQRIGNQIDAAVIFARVDFVNVQPSLLVARVASSGRGGTADMTHRICLCDPSGRAERTEREHCSGQKQKNFLRGIVVSGRQKEKIN